MKIINDDDYARIIERQLKDEAIWFTPVLEDNTYTFSKDFDEVIEWYENGYRLGMLKMDAQINNTMVDGVITVDVNLYDRQFNYLEDVKVPRNKLPKDVIKWNKYSEPVELEDELDLYGGIAVDEPVGEERDINIKNINMSLTDVGNVERFLGMYKDTVRYCNSFGWLYWNGKRWVTDDAEVYKMGSKAAQGIYAEAASYKDANISKEQVIKVGNWAKASLSKHRIDAIIGIAKHYVMVDADTFDNNPFLLNVNNGVVNLLTGELLPHDPKYYFTKIVEADYNPNAECPKWLEFMDLILPDKDLQTFIQKAVGYSLTGSVDEQCLFFLYNSRGNNGKSTFVEALQLLLNEFALKTDIQALLENKGTTNPLLAKFYKMRAIVTSETEEYGNLNSRMVKDLTGGDTISVNPKYKDPFTFKPTHKIWIYGNHKPTVKETTKAFWRRIRLIPFEVEIPRSVRKSMRIVLREFKEELGGILTWAVRGCMLWDNEGLDIPAKVKEATNEYQTEQDLFKQFVDDDCELGDEFSIKKEYLLMEYNDFLYRNGETQKVRTGQVTRRLKELGVTVGKHGRAYYLGIHVVKDINLTTADAIAIEALDVLYGKTGAL